ncbi:MAG: hypothetical protein JOY64_33760 [Alphaproteobacteria bacterium]|nr:hypothetical protein [Alphaproteobacteria bacterium]
MSVREEAAGIGQEVGQALSRKAEDIADRSKEAGADAAASAARTAQAVADSVAGQSPAVADYVRDAGQKIDRLANNLREKSVGELLSSAAEFGRSQPVVLIAGAALVGFALSRMIKAGVTASSNGANTESSSGQSGASGNGSAT